MHHQTIEYHAGGTPCKGFLAVKQDGKAKKPAVIVFHTWQGLDDFAKKQAERLAEMGYIGFAADVYGHGTVAKTDEKAEELMAPLFINRKLLQERILGAFKTIAEFEGTDVERIGAIGFCFGGLTAIELIRSGAPVKGVVSFHGVLGNRLGQVQAQPAGPSQMKGALLVLHGHEDPLVSAKDIAALEEECTQAGIDWQFHVYGHAKHAFTNPAANDAGKGLIYNEKAAKRSMKSMELFFEEIFK